MTVRGIVVDFGNTVVHQQIDDSASLNQLDLQLIDGAADALRKLHRVYPTAVLSNTEMSTSQHLSDALRKLGLGDLDLVALTSVSVQARKPDRRAFQAAARALGTELHSLVMIGNDPYQDIAGAHAAGMATVHVLSGSTEEALHADVVVDSLADVEIETVERARIRFAARATGSLPNARTASLPQEVVRAVELESVQEWRLIGNQWLEAARGARPELDSGTESWLGTTFPDAAVHHFPHFSPGSWNNLSMGQRAGTAFRYAGYHFEGDAERQTAFVHYVRSGDCFWADGKADEAARSYYLALASYTKRYGEISSVLLEKLESATKAAVPRDETRYLASMVVHYRKVCAILQDQGNSQQALELRIKRKDAERQLLRVQGSRLRFVLATLWKQATGYGQSLQGWIGVLVVATAILFPALYAIPAVSDVGLSLRAGLFSLGRAVLYTATPVRLTTAGQVVVIAQALVTLIWVGVFAAILVNRFSD